MVDKWTIFDMAWTLRNFINDIVNYEKSKSWNNIEDTPYYDAAQALAIVQNHGMGDIYPISGFVAEVLCGGFINYDGFGNWITEHGDKLGWVDCNKDTIQKQAEKMRANGAKFVVWYNK